MKKHESEAEIVQRIKNLPVDHRNRADEARLRLGVTQEQLDGEIKISNRLREVGLTAERVVELLDEDDSPDSRTFVNRYRQISQSDLAYLPIESIALAAGLTPRRLWELISGARLQQSQDVVKLIISDSMPKVVANAVRAATTGTPFSINGTPMLDSKGDPILIGYGDMKATEFLGKVSGLMPMPKGVTTILNVGNSGPLPSERVEVDELPLQDMDSTLKQLQQITAVPQLEAPKVEVPLIADVEFEDVPLEAQ